MRLFVQIANSLTDNVNASDLIPAFVEQIREIHRNLKVQAEITSRTWSDSVQARFYENYSEDIGEDLDRYVSYWTKILASFDEAETKINEMLGGDGDCDDDSSSTVYYDDGIRYDTSELDSVQIGDIMNDRQDW